MAIRGKTTTAIRDFGVGRGLALLLLYLGLVATARAEVSLELIADPDPVKPGGWVHQALIVRNDGTAAEGGVIVSTRIPDQVFARSQVMVFDGATCTSGCDPNELVTWSLGSLAPGEIRQLRMSYRVYADAVIDGDLIPQRAQLT